MSECDWAACHEDVEWTAFYYRPNEVSGYCKPHAAYVLIKGQGVALFKGIP